MRLGGDGSTGSTAESGARRGSLALAPKTTVAYGRPVVAAANRNRSRLPWFVGSMSMLPSALNEVLETLREAWIAARNGRGRLVHITAPIGRGKSTVLSHFLETVDGPGQEAAVVSANCGDDRIFSSERGVLEDLILRVAEGVRAIEVSDETDADKPVKEAVPWFLPAGEFLPTATSVAVLPSAMEAGPGPTQTRIYSELLLDVARDYTVVIVLDDAHRADVASCRIIEALAAALREDSAFHLLVVLASPRPLAGSTVDQPNWCPDAGSVIELPPMAPEALREELSRRLSRFGTSDPKEIDELVALADGNPRVLHGLVRLAERAGLLKRTPDRAVTLEGLLARPEIAGLRKLACGELPEIPANVRADLQAAAIVGRRFRVGPLARLWEVPAEAALLRVQALEATGLVEAEGSIGDGDFRFLSGELAACFSDELPPDTRRSLHGRIATLLRAEIDSAPHDAEESQPPLIDVTETWSETRQRDRLIRDAFEKLWSAARHFAHAGRHALAAEAAITLAERLFDTSGGYSYLAGRYGRREDRERRHRIYMALSEAAWQLGNAKSQAGPGTDGELLAISTRLLTVRARFKEVMGDFTHARALADSAVELASFVTRHQLRLDAMRVRTEICYAAGDLNAGRQSLVTVFKELERAPKEHAIRTYEWLAESISRWEWVALHDRMHPVLIDRLRALGADRAAIKARIDRLAAAYESEPLAEPREPLLEEIITDARGADLLPYAAELLAATAADLIAGLVDAHYDTLSGEFCPPDLFAEGVGAQLAPLQERLDWPIRLLDRAESLAQETRDRVASLRILTTKLSLIYDVRERCSELLDRWMPLQEDSDPIRLTELVELLEYGLFSVDHLEEVVGNTILLAQTLGLDQVLADTIYEALDHELPGAMQRSGTLFELATQAYERVGDAYGLITLQLVELRHCGRQSHAATRVLASALRIYDERNQQFNTEQQAFVSSRLGEILLADERTDEALEHLERSIQLYEQLGDMERMQNVGERLRNLYREKGDFGRYRTIRERFRALEQRMPGVDPLGLELRIEHLLAKARQEADEERAIEMVERCVRLFGHMPDGTTRIDECFVEISKICRRRADDAQSEAGMHDWLRRSLAAVETATSINRSLGNFHRLFEEHHELFDDLLGLSDYEEYLRARAESRELAFTVGDVAELIYLFDEHIHTDPEGSFDMTRLPEVRGFYEALLRYLLGLGAHPQALALKRAFLRFLTAVGETEMADTYRARPPFGSEEEAVP